MGSAVFAAVAALVFGGIAQFPDRAVDASSLPPLPPGTELLTPADLGLSQGDLDKFLGKVKVLAGREGGGSKTQILAVGFDENEKLNLENFQELSTDGLDGRDKGVVAEALKGFRKQYGNNREQDSSGSESEEYSQIVQLNAGQQGQPVNPHLAAVEAVRDKQHAEQFKIAQQQQEQQNQQRQVQEQHYQINQQQQQQNAQQQHFQPTEQQQLEQQQIQDDAEQQRALIEEQLRIQLQIQAQEQQQNLVQPQIQQIPSQQHVQVEQQQIQDQQQQHIQNQQQIQDQQQIHEQQQQILGDVQQQGPVMFVLQHQPPQAQVDAGLPVTIQATPVPHLAQQDGIQQQYVQLQQPPMQHAYLQQQFGQQEQVPIQQQPQQPIQQQFVQFQQQPTQQEYAQEQRPIQQEYVQFQQPIQQEYVQFRQPVQQEFLQQQPPAQQQFAQQLPPAQQHEFAQQQPPAQQHEFTQQQHVSYQQPSTAPAVVTGPAYQTYDQPTRGSYIRPQPSEVIQSSIRPSYDQIPSQDISEHSFRLKHRPTPNPVPLPAQHMAAPVAKESQPNWSRYPGYRSPAIPVAKPDQLYKEYVTYHNVHSPVQNEVIDLKAKPDNGGLFGKYVTTFRDAVKSYSPNSVNSESPVKSAFGSDPDRYRYRNLASTLSFGSAYRTTDSREQYRDSESSYYPPSQAPNRWFDSASSNRYRAAKPEVMHPTPRPYTGAFEVTPSTPLIRISNPENAMPPRARTARSGGLDIIAAASSNVHSAYLRGPSHYDRTKARVDLWYRRR